MTGKLVSGIFAVLLAVGIGVASGGPASLPTALPEDVGMSSARLARMAPVMQQDIDRQLVPGYVTLIARHGKVVDVEAQGWQDVATKTPMQKDSLF